MTETISRSALARSIASASVLVVEALGVDFYRSGHLPTAVNVPLSATDALIRRTLGDADLPVVVYGTADGGVAQELADRIEQLCGCAVSIYAGGKEDWVEAGLPIVRSAANPGPASAGVQE